MSSAAPLPNVSPALRALREATAAAHAGLEGKLRIASPGAGRADYALHVASMWGWLQPLEPALWAGAWPEDAEAGARGVKTAWLEEDLSHARAGGYVRGEIARNAEPVAFHSLAQRIGVAYVIEGSTLGGEVLRRRLAAAVAPWPMRYFEGYGALAGQRWRDFLGVIAAHLDSRERIAQAAESAQGAFGSLEAWFAARGAA